jgi:hypothetical protein
MGERSGMPRRANRILAALLFALTALGAVGVPILLLRGSTAYFDSGPCGTAEAPTAPGPVFFSQIERLDRLAKLPWTAKAAGVALTGATECLEVFTGSCSVLRDDAVEAARTVIEERLQGDGDSGEAGTDWRAHIDEGRVRVLCNQWSHWREWLTDEGLDAAAACALCGEI